MPEIAPAAPGLRDAAILIVDDEEANIRLLARILARAGFGRVRTTMDPRNALPLFREMAPDLVVLDIHMPALDGFAVLAQLRGVVSATDFLPVLAITGDGSQETRQRVIAAGAKDFLEKPFEAAEVVVRIENLLTTRMLHKSLLDQNDLLECKVRERTNELEAALAVAQAASHAKSQFLATMSHELRTPLNSVIGFSQQLQKNKANNLSPQDLDYLARIHDNGSHLLSIINDILDLSRIEAGKVELDRSAVDLHRLISDTVDRMAPESARSPQVAVHIDVPAIVRPLTTDSSQLQRVLINLVSNAVKFTKAGHFRVAVVADEMGNAQRIDVVDTGIGVPRDRLDAIFERFEQGDNGTQRQFGGTGLGLAISRTLCGLLGFRLTVVSDPGVGSAFSVLLDASAKAPMSYAELATERQQQVA